MKEGRRGRERERKGVSEDGIQVIVTVSRRSRPQIARALAEQLSSPCQDISLFP